MNIHTIGHSTRPQGKLIGLLTEAGVELLIDGSLHYPARQGALF